MASKDPAALLYIDVWKTATTEMSAIERAYYMDLILHQYDKGSLPNDIEELANICRVRFSEFEQFKQVFEQVLKHKFVQNENGRLENGFASDIIRKRQKFIEKRSMSGKISYVVRYASKHLNATNKQIEYLKESLDFDSLDLKNEHMLKQVLKQKIELYINGDVNENKKVKVIKKETPLFSENIYLEFEFFKDDFETIWIDEFIPLKKKKRASVSDRALKSQLNKIKKLSNNDYSVAKEILEKSVNSGWTDFYELKQANNNGHKKTNTKPKRGNLKTEV